MFYLTKTSKCSKTRYKIWHLIRTNNQSKMVEKRVTKSRTNEEMVFIDGLLILCPTAKMVRSLLKKKWSLVMAIIKRK